MSIADALSLMTPGAVFVNKNGRTAKLLFVTNTSLLTTASQDVQDEHPMQVVYANDDNEVFSRVLEDFIKRYKFYNVDAELESRLENLFVFSENDPAHEAIAAEVDDEEDDQGDTRAFPTVATVTTGRTSTVAADSYAGTQTNKIVADALRVSGEQALEDAMSYLPPEQELKIADQRFLDKHKPSAVVVKFSTMSGDASMLPVCERLSQALVAYTQAPDISQRILVHRLTFALSSDLTIAMLADMFRPNEDGEDQRSTMDVFEVRTAYSVESTMWTSYLGVFPEYVTTGLYAAVMIGTDEFRDVAEEVEEPEAEADEQSGTEAPEQEYSQMHDEADAGNPGIDLLYGSGQPDGTPIVQTMMDVSQLPAHLHGGHAMTQEGMQGVFIQTNPDNLISQNDAPVADASNKVYTLEEVSKLDPQQLLALVQSFQTAEISSLPPRGLRNADSLVIDPSSAQLFAPRGDIPGAL